MDPDLRAHWVVAAADEFAVRSWPDDELSLAYGMRQRTTHLLDPFAVSVLEHLRVGSRSLEQLARCFVADATDMPEAHQLIDELVEALGPLQSAGLVAIRRC